MTGMRDAEKDRLALSVADRHSEFEEALAGNRRKYPTREFQSFAEAVRRYVEQTGGDEMMHRDVVGTVHGLVDYLRVERKRVPGEVLVEAERLECLLFSRLRSALRRGRTSWSLTVPVQCLPKARFRVCHLGLMVGKGSYRQEPCLVASAAAQ